jgi:predicted aldo/keto reductase-like oxidoreductase
VDIPRNLKIYNQFKANPRRRGSLKAMNYNSMGEDERASACVKCGVCLRKCPQGINIPELMETVAGEFA